MMASTAVRVTKWASLPHTPLHEDLHENPPYHYEKQERGRGGGGGRAVPNCQKQGNDIYCIWTIPNSDHSDPRWILSTRTYHYSFWRTASGKEVIPQSFHLISNPADDVPSTFLDILESIRESFFQELFHKGFKPSKQRMCQRFSLPGTALFLKGFPGTNERILVIAKHVGREQETTYAALVGTRKHRIEHDCQIPKTSLSVPDKNYRLCYVSRAFIPQTAYFRQW